MKIGDKVLCKESFQFGRMGIKFTKGIYYKVTDISLRTDQFFVLSDSGGECDFSIGDSSDDEYKFEDHFYTIKQLRKLKLKNLYA